MLNSLKIATDGYLRRTTNVALIIAIAGYFNVSVEYLQEKIIGTSNALVFIIGNSNTMEKIQGNSIPLVVVFGNSTFTGDKKIIGISNATRKVTGNSINDIKVTGISKIF